jgi:NhaP-type Na+/H+ or K+/H+ antiporter
LLSYIPGLIIFVTLGIRYRDGPFGNTHGSFLLVAITALLLIRMIFYAVTLDHSSAQQNEHLWYPLVALPELVAAALFIPPGLVPPRAELKARAEAAEALASKDNNSSNQGHAYPPLAGRVPV